MFAILFLLLVFFWIVYEFFTWTRGNSHAKFVNRDVIRKVKLAGVVVNPYLVSGPPSIPLDCGRVSDTGDTGDTGDIGGVGDDSEEF